MTDAPDMELKPCPLCGGKAELWRAHPENPKLNAWVACADRCLVLTQEFESDEAAIAHWNHRPLAARSAPEAGKVVTDAATALVNFAWSAVVTDCTEAAEYLNELVGNLRAALASSPAPTGAEPVACKRCKGEGSVADYVGDDMRCIETGCPDCTGTGYASPQPVAPTGEIAGLIERLDSHMGMQDVSILLRDCRLAAAALTASEAEAADLRRKLEEHQDAEDKAAREMATVIQGLRNRATAAERKLEERDKRIAKLEADLAFADEQSAKVEALLEPHVQWECASEGCGKPATVHFVRGGVGSWYCRDCYMRTQAIPAGRSALESDNG